MSEVNIVSDVYKIDSNVEKVYAFLSDFNKIGNMVNIARQVGVGGDGGEMLKMAEKIEDVSFTEDYCVITVKDVGDIIIRIVEKEENKLIKLGGDGIPFDYNLWIQLLDNGPYDTRLRLTFRGDMNMMMKMMLKGKLEKGINQLAQGLAKIPYIMLG